MQVRILIQVFLVLGILLFPFSSGVAQDYPSADEALLSFKSAHSTEEKIKIIERMEARGPEAPQYLSTYVDCLNNADAPLRKICARSIGKLGSKAGAAAEKLSILLTDEDDSVRIEAIRSLGRIGPGAEVAVAGLLRALSRSNKSYRISILATLQEIGGAEIITAPEFEHVLHDQDWLVRSFALDVLAKAQPEKANRLLISALDDENAQVAKTADLLAQRYGDLQTKLLLIFYRFKRHAPYVLVVFLAMLLVRRKIIRLFF